MSTATRTILKPKNRVGAWAALLLLLPCVPLPVLAAPEARTLLDQSRQLSQTSRKWTDRLQRLQLQIVDRRGGERQRDLVMRFKKYPEDRTRSTVFFESPPDVKGVSFLQWADPHGKDVQWLYLPELKRVRQISSGARHDSFMGTDFSYDDLALIDQILDWSDSDARITTLREEPVDGRLSHVIEFVPTGKDLTYSKVILWLTKDDSVMVRLEMYDKRDQLEKRLSLTDIRNVGTIPTAFQMEMSNMQTGSKTVVRFAEVKYDSGLNEELFTQRALEQAP